MADFNHDIPEEYLDDSFDFGFTAADDGDLNELLELDLILEMNSTCEGANQVKAQYDELLKAKLLEIERAVVPLLLNLKKNKAKDYIHWPGKQREAQCDLQIQKVLGMTRSGL